MNYGDIPLFGGAADNDAARILRLEALIREARQRARVGLDSFDDEDAFDALKVVLALLASAALPEDANS